MQFSCLRSHSCACYTFLLEWPPAGTQVNERSGLRVIEGGQTAILPCCRLSHGAVGRQASLVMQQHRISANPHGEANAFELH